MIRRDTLVEDLVNTVPEAIPYLMDKGIQAIACGAPIWGTLEEAARSHGYNDDQISAMVAEIRELERSRMEHPANTDKTP
jgi:methionine synthase II (cobalamin-independent)